MMEKKKKREFSLKLLVIDLSIHITVSILLAVFFYFKKGGLLWPVLCIVGGILIDLDHLIDNHICYGRLWWQDFFQANYLYSGKIYMPLHAWEVIALLAVLSYVPSLAWLTPITAGMAGHLIVDHIVHLKGLRHYSLIYKWYNNFELEKIDPDFFDKNDK